MHILNTLAELRNTAFADMFTVIAGSGCSEIKTENMLRYLQRSFVGLLHTKRLNVDWDTKRILIKESRK